MKSEYQTVGELHVTLFVAGRGSKVELGVQGEQLFEMGTSLSWRLRLSHGPSQLVKWR